MSIDYDKYEFKAKWREYSVLNSYKDCINTNCHKVIYSETLKYWQHDIFKNSNYASRSANIHLWNFT